MIKLSLCLGVDIKRLYILFEERVNANFQGESLEDQKARRNFESEITTWCFL